MRKEIPSPVSTPTETDKTIDLLAQCIQTRVKQAEKELSVEELSRLVEMACKLSLADKVVSFRQQIGE